MAHPDLPGAHGLYDPAHEHDACGVGFVVDLQNRPSHEIVRKGLQILVNLEHRGACGCEKNTGDGSGILMQMPHRFMARAAASVGITLPAAGEYGAGLVFLPTDPEQRRACEAIFEKCIVDEGQEFLGWRDVPSNNGPIGPSARATEPVMRHLFVGRKGLPERPKRLGEDLAFERKLYVIRRCAENAVRATGLRERGMFYVPSLSARTLIYKGMLTAAQLGEYFPDLDDPELESALALVHQRFSTNTFPNWARAHPYRFVAHNGEINTLRGNVNWMHARQSLFASPLFGDDLAKLMPIIDAEGSDSAMFDNTLELLTLAGRSLPHAIMMMIPEPWTAHATMSAEKKAFYEYHSCLMEPWDGPASIAFTDGMRIGAVLDRNGLRPSRYYETKDGLVILASEAGVLDIPPENVKAKGRLQPGRMFLVDLSQGRIVDDADLKFQIATAKPYAKWLKQQLVALEDLAESPHGITPDHKTVLERQQAFGYTAEDVRILMAPMAADGNEAVGSMGNDAALAVLSERPQLLYNYFRQLFAQVTNPPVDGIREDIIMSLDTTIGGEGNLLEPDAEACRQIKLKSPILKNEELEKLRLLDGTSKKGGGRPLMAGRFKSVTLPMLFRAAGGAEELPRALDELCRQASAAIADGNHFIILSDRGIDREHAAIPALLATAGVHHHLIREGTRTRVGLIVETGEPREVHHFALLIGFGAGAVNPYLAFETLDDLIRQGVLRDVDSSTAIKNFVKAVNKGVLKVMSKMGISTAQSYCGAQIFEAVGIGQEVIDRYFTWTASRIGGIGLDVIAREVLKRHAHAYPDRQVNGQTLDAGGSYQWRREGELHLFNPETVHKLQLACRTGKYEFFKQYSAVVNDRAKNLCTLRGLFKIRFAEQPVPLEEVESVDSIVKRFKSGAMSYGSVSKEAHETMAIAMNRLGGKSNTGEGGEDPQRYVLDANGDSRNSAIKQVASGRFGVTSEYLVNARELQIKMAQGAKPGEGGQLPGAKVYPWIAKVRHSTPGVGLISPPPHHDIYSIEDLAELIHDLKNGNHEARISVKLVAEVGVGTIAAGVAKAHADVVLISGHDGGTGASPLTSIKHAGAPWELGLAETQQVLLLNKLRNRIVVEVDGQLKTGRDVVIGALLGAEEFGFATAPLVALGCVMMRVCHLNTCPVGVATQDPVLRARFTGDPQHAVNFMRFIAEEVRELMAQLGFRKFEEMIGQSDRLGVDDAVHHYKTQGLDFGKILHHVKAGEGDGLFCQIAQDHGLDASLDRTTLLKLCKPALEKGTPVNCDPLPIRNIHRVVGTLVGSDLTRRWGAGGLPADTIRLRFEGSAGQSFGAFLPPGMTLILEGDANDYVGKGLSGGKIVVFPPAASTFPAEENVIIGNVAFYGATAGEAYIRGIAGERFCVRNSGVIAVVEGVGDHGCEYMTNGRVVILGMTGRNFAAGMSGGIAYVLDEVGDFSRRCNHEMVKLTRLTDEDADEVRMLVRRHAELTGSEHAWRIFATWDEMRQRFVKVFPNDYRRVVEKQKRFKEAGLSEEEAAMAAFEENAHDLARAGGK